MKPIKPDPPYTRRDYRREHRRHHIGKGIIITYVIALILIGWLLCRYIDTVSAAQLPQTETMLPATVEPEIVEPVSLGTFTITHYTNSVECCGKTDGITATGAIAQPNHTIAVDPDVIPYGTEVLIDGVTYVAEDGGGAIDGNRIDIFVASMDEAVRRGVISREVFISK